MLLKQTKIVASISDRRCDVDFIKQLFDAGMNVVRMNTAHASREGFEALIANVRAVSNRIAILMDTKGPEVRTTANAEPIPYQIGERVKIVGNPDLETTRECIAVSYPNFVRDLNVGGTILIDDGDLELRVIDKTDDYLICEVQNEATLGSRKSVNVPGVRINLPSLTEKDRNNILYAIEKDIDFIAHSFVRNRQDVLDIREILDAHNSDIKIIAKIENQEGVDNIDEILEVADGVMVARGDLGIEVPQERIPGIQRTLIRKCVLAKKPVIVSMGDYAASGGYYISCAADSIIAEPTTLTGSIGIFGMIPNVKGLTEKIGLTYDVVKTNQFSDFGNLMRPVNSDERALLQMMIGQGYDLFVSRCAEGRHMSKDKIEKIAEGRVWTGEMAKKIGLVDELGGIGKALEIAAQKADLKGYTIISYPAKKDILSTLLDVQPGNYVESQVLKSQLGDYYKDFSLLKNIKERAMIQARVPFELNVK